MFVRTPSEVGLNITQTHKASELQLGSGNAKISGKHFIAVCWGVLSWSSWLSFAFMSASEHFEFTASGCRWKRDRNLWAIEWCRSSNYSLISVATACALCPFLFLHQLFLPTGKSIGPCWGAAILRSSYMMVMSVVLCNHLNIRNYHLGTLLGNQTTVISQLW